VTALLQAYPDLFEPFRPESKRREFTDFRADLKALVSRYGGAVNSGNRNSSYNVTHCRTEGRERLLRILHKFVVLYPLAKACLRVCPADPPAVADLLEQIASDVISREIAVEGMQFSVFRTLERPLGLGTEDQPLEPIAEVFADDERRRFLLEIHPEKSTYADVLQELKRQSVHVFVVFDPSKSQVGQFAGPDAGFIHPLVLPREFQYDPMEDRLVIRPAATGDLFDLYYNIRNRLNNSLTGATSGSARVSARASLPPRRS